MPTPGHHLLLPRYLLLPPSASGRSPSRRASTFQSCTLPEFRWGPGALSPSEADSRGPTRWPGLLRPPEGPTAHSGHQHGEGGDPRLHTVTSRLPCTPDEAQAPGRGGQVPTVHSQRSGQGPAGLRLEHKPSRPPWPPSGFHLPGPTSKDRLPGHFLCPGRPRGRHPGARFLPTPPEPQGATIRGAVRTDMATLVSAQPPQPQPGETSLHTMTRPLAPRP